MKKCIVFLLVLFLYLNSSAQNIYETRWYSNGVKYTGLLIFYNDSNATMRVKYTINGTNKVAEFKCYGSNYDEGGYKGYFLDGQNAKVVRGSNGNGYSADNFIFVNQNGIYSTPVHVDDNGLKNFVDENLTAVDYWNILETNDLTEYFVQSFFEKDEPLYNTLLSLNKDYGQKNASSYNHKITSVSYGDGVWSCVMSKNTGFSAEKWVKRSTFPKQEINSGWNDGYQITSITYGDLEWALVMSKNTKYTTQKWWTRTNFPEDEIQQGWDEGYRISTLTYGNGLWALVMSKSYNTPGQKWRTRSYFPEEEIRDGWDEGYEITSLTYGNGLWALVMTKDTEYTTQRWRTRSYFPKEEIKEGWDEGYYITSLEYGNGLWALVMSKGTAYTKQSWRKDTYFPNNWIKDKWRE